MKPALCHFPQPGGQQRSDQEMPQGYVLGFVHAGTHTAAIIQHGKRLIEVPISQVVMGSL